MKDLSGTWRLYLAENETAPAELLSARCEEDVSRLCTKKLSGTVPGNLELDLMAAGLLPDLYFGENTLLAQELEYTHLWYCTDFEVSKAEGDEELLFEGLDTVGDVYLNGEHIGSCDNMFIPHSFPARSLLPGKNSLTVHITPAVIEARRRSAGAASDMALSYNFDSLTVRKAAYMYGWDIMPRIVSGGIWKPVKLVSPPSHSIDQLYIRTDSAGADHASLRVYVNLRLAHDRIRDYELVLKGSCGESSFEVRKPLWHTEFSFGFGVSEPKLWWPKTMGRPELYSVTAELLYRGDTVAKKEQSLGIRTVELERSSYLDEDGNGSFCFRVNGEPFFAIGTNWVPTDSFPSRMKERLPGILELLQDSGSNMVRCCGGCVYEDDEFYEFCDSHGIAVWQDFMMGCAIYPQTKEFARSLEAEAESVVKRLRSHPCLFCWAGDNECDQSWQWGGRLDPNTSVPTRKTIPDVLHVHDPWRPYLPSSPYIDSEAYRTGNIGRIPEDHLWGPRDYYKGEFYSNAPAVFASETGYHGCTSPQSVKRYISPEHLTPDPKDKEWLVHAASMEATGSGPYDYRIKLMSDQVAVLFGKVPSDLESYALASQISQSEAKKFFIERFRCAKWKRTGILWWNLIDGWPQFSDAVTDWYGVKKLAYHTIRRISAPVCGMLTPGEGETLRLVFANENLTERSLSYRVFDALSGEEFASGTAVCSPNSAVCAAGFPEPRDQRVLSVTWSAEGTEGLNHYVCGKPPYDLNDLSQRLRAAGVLELSGF